MFVTSCGAERVKNEMTDQFALLSVILLRVWKSSLLALTRNLARLCKFPAMIMLIRILLVKMPLIDFFSALALPPYIAVRYEHTPDEGPALSQRGDVGVPS